MYVIQGERETLKGSDVRGFRYGFFISFSHIPRPQLQRVLFTCKCQDRHAQDRHVRPVQGPGKLITYTVLKGQGGTLKVTRKYEIEYKFCRLGLKLRTNTKYMPALNGPRWCGSVISGISAVAEIQPDNAETDRN